MEERPGEVRAIVVGRHLPVADEHVEHAVEALPQRDRVACVRRRLASEEQAKS
jgi:hypothetical protein